MSTLKSDCDGNSSESIYRSYSFIHDHKPCKGNSSSLDSVPETKWWLNGHGLGRENQLIDEYYTTYAKNDTAFCSDAQLMHSHSHCKNNENSWLQEFESTFDVDLLSERPKKLCSDLDSNWIGLKKIEPWWDAVDKDDLVSLVSRTSSHHIRNCDRPGHWSMLAEKVSDNCEFCFDKLEMTDHTQGNLDSESMDKSVGKRGLMDCMLPESDGTFSSRDSLNTSKVNSSDTQEPSNDLSRSQLLEALCHSQTRAREAEKFAQEACDEKDHIINLFFQQASCLFAYRQWLRLLQLETLCLHLTSKDHPSSFNSPALVSRAQNKGMMLRKNRRRAAKMNKGKSRCYVSKCAIAFAVGLSLASAGLLVGWTIGWLFPAL